MFFKSGWETLHCSLQQVLLKIVNESDYPEIWQFKLTLWGLSNQFKHLKVKLILNSINQISISTNEIFIKYADFDLKFDSKSRIDS